VLPDYDQDRVYASDMKKLAQWYTIVNQFVPYAETEATKTASAEDSKEDSSAAAE
jgi:hypothetical protein